MSEIQKRTVTNAKGKKETVVYVKTKNGKWIQLLNPSQKGRKYSKELKSRKSVYNGRPLAPTQLSFRSGYLKARSDNAGAWKANKAKKAAKRAAKK